MINRERLLIELGACRFWLGELHGWYWHHARTTQFMKALQKQIKKVDRILEKEAKNAKSDS